MESKKKKSLVTDRYSAVFRELGIAISLALVLMSFHLKSPKPKYDVPVIEEDTITWVSDPTPLTQEPPKQKEVKEQQEQTSKDLTVIIFTNDPVPEFDTSMINVEVPIELPPIDFSFMEKTIPDPIPWEKLDKMPSFPGGEDAFGAFLRKNIIYPSKELYYGISGTVWLQFTINKSGKVIDVEVAKGSTQNFDKEAFRVGKMIPNWTPGYQAGVPVKCRFVVPIVFRTGS